MGWAENAARERKEQDRDESLRIERQVRDERILDERGRSVFEQLQQWIVSEVSKYNQALGKPELTTDFTNTVDFSYQPCPVLIVRRLDGQRGPLRISYSQASHSVHYEYGAGKGEYKLVVGSDGVVRFETPNHVAKTMEELGTELLDLFQKSQF